MKAYIKYGLLAGLVTVALSLINFYGKFQDTSFAFIFSILTYAITAIAIFMALREKRMAQGDYLTFGQGVGEGMRVVLIAGIFIAVANYIDTKFFNRELLDTIQAKMNEGIESGNMSDEDMEAAAQYMKNIVSPGGLAVIMFIRTLFMGLILSLIISAVLRKEDGENRANNPMYGDN